MKKYFLLFTLLVAFLASCSSFDAERRPLDKNAAKIAVDNYSVGYNTIKQFAIQTKNSTADITPYVKDSDTLFYFINSDQGWKIISNDQRATPVLASGYDGVFNPESTGKDEIRIWLEAASDYIRAVRESPLDDDQQQNLLFWKANKKNDARQADSLDNGSYKWKLVVTTDLYSIYNTDVIPHLISTKWGQSSPWNNEIPIISNYYYNGFCYTGQCPIGCVAVAISQILYYWHHTFGYPNSLYHNVDINGTQQFIAGVQSNLIIDTSNYVNSSRWNDMPLTSSGAHTDYVGDLMLYVGKRVYMHYTPIGSGSRVYYFDFEENGMAYSQSSYNYATVSSCLDNGKPVIVEAWPNNSNEGHAWIIDGKLSRVYTYRTTSTWYELDDGNIHGSVPEGTYYYTEEQALSIDPDLYDGKTSYSYTSTTNKYLRMNWGSDGEYDNAEYSASVFWHPVNNNGGNNSLPTFNTNAVIYYNFTTQNK